MIGTNLFVFKILAEDFNLNFKPFTDYFNKDCNEDDFSNLVYLIRANNSMVDSSIKNEHKFINFMQVLIYLNSSTMLSDKGINTLFEFFKLEEVENINLIGACLNRLIRNLVFSDNYLTKLYEVLDKFKLTIDGDFEKKISTIINKSYELLNERPDLKRKLKRSYSAVQTYAITKIVEFSFKYDQFLNPNSNWAIYNSIMNNESVVQQIERSNFIDLFKKIKRYGRYHNFGSLDDKIKTTIRRRIKRKYKEFKKDQKNFKINKSRHSDDQKFILNKIQAKMSEENQLSWKSVFRMYNKCEPIGKPLSLAAIKACLLRSNDKNSSNEKSSVKKSRKEQIIKIVDEEYESVKDEKRATHTRKSDEMAYVCLSLVGKIDAAFIFEVLKENNLVDCSFEATKTWVRDHKSEPLPIIKDQDTISRLDIIIYNSLNKYSNRSSKSKYTPEDVYLVIKLFSKINHKYALEVLNQNHAILPGPKFSSVKSAEAFYYRNKDKSLPFIEDSIKVQLDQIIENSIAAYKNA